MKQEMLLKELGIKEAKYRGVEEDEARNDLIRVKLKELGSLKEAMLKKYLKLLN